MVEPQYLHDCLVPDPGEGSVDAGSETCDLPSEWWQHRQQTEYLLWLLVTIQALEIFNSKNRLNHLASSFIKIIYNIYIFVF